METDVSPRKYLIADAAGKSERLPTVGKWYASMHKDKQCEEMGINGGFRDGVLAKYHDDGNFYQFFDPSPENDFDVVDLSDADFLQEQL